MKSITVILFLLIPIILLNFTFKEEVKLSSKAALGKKLFSEKILSLDSSVDRKSVV